MNIDKYKNAFYLINSFYNILYIKYSEEFQHEFTSNTFSIF